MTDPLIETTRTIAGVNTRTVTAAGDPHQPHLLFLHGFSDSADGWRRLQRRMAAAGVGSTAVDQPAHGIAGPLDPTRSVVEQYVEFAAETVRHLVPADQAVVVGNSLGGAHALALAQRHPELVSGVVAISPASFDHPRWFGVLDRERVQARAGREGPAVPRAIARVAAGPAMRAVAFGVPWRAPGGFIADWRRSMTHPERGMRLRQLSLRVADEYFHDDPVDLTAITQPVLALWGTRDRLTLISSRERFEAEVPDLTFVALRGIGHMPQLEAPGLTTKYLRRFTDRFVADAPVPVDATPA